jgi:hypothetical protein
MVTEPPPGRGANDESDEEPTRVQPDDLRRALEVRDEARALLQQALEEALAPLHFAVRDLERRLAAIEAPPPPSYEAPPPAVPRPQPLPALPPPAVAAVVQRPPTADPFASVVVAPEVAIPAAPRAPSLDWDVPFDGARRRRRIALLFAVFVVLIFGALFGALISSRVG